MLKGKTPLLIALVLAVLAASVAMVAVRNAERDARKGWNLVPVIVANEDIPEGTVISYEMISSRLVPETFVTGSVVKPDSASYVVNQKVLVPLQRGDPLLWSQFEGTRFSEKLSTKVQKKTRAITLDMSGSNAVGQWVRPNDHVDIIGTFNDPQGNEKVAVTLLENLVVLATGKITGTTNVNLIPESDRSYQNVSLLVIPEEAEMLVLAQALGSLTLVLRNEDDFDVIEERGHASIGTLLSGVRAKALQKKRQNIIEVVRGGADKSAATTPSP